jgi:site-specific recombinase XerD
MAQGGMPRSPDLIPWKDPKRKTSPWRVSIPPKLSETGKRQRRYFKSKTEANQEIKRVKVRQENHGTAAKLLAPSDEEQAAAALKLLKQAGDGKQLVEIVQEYLQRKDDDAASVTLNHCWNQYIKGTEGRHKKNLERTLKRFEPVGEMLVSKLTAEDIEGCLEGASDTYWNAMLREVKAVLNFAKLDKHGWLKKNPADEIDKRTHELGEVQIYTVDQVKALMAATVRIHPDLVPAMAVMAFAGIRPDPDDGEIIGLDWSHILHNDRRHERIELPRSITKTGKQRSVKIRPALLSWIRWHIKKKRRKSGLVCPEKGEALRKKLRSIYEEAQVTRIQDGLRHSFASYLAPIDGLNVVETELGHQGGREVLNRHYRTDVRKPIAKKFWAIRAPQK